MKYCRVFRYSLPLFLFWVITIAAQSQETKPIINASLVGTVVDATTKNPIEGATVQLEAVTHSVKTDRNGKFSFVTGQKLPFTVIVSYLGYTSKKVVLSKSPATIELDRQDQSLEEVVVVGYGKQERKDLIGSVSKIDPANTKTIPESTFDTQIQGTTAGVWINGGTGIPGSNTFIRVRGATSINSSNDPLYIVDGIFVNNTSLQQIGADRGVSPLADINPNDIESIEVLKDASAIAIYGSRGANGVVIVTTKRGNFDQRPKLDFNLSQGVGWVPESQKWKLVTGPQHAELVEEYRANEGLPPLYTETSGRGLPEDQETYDRLSILFRNARLQNYDASIRGGGQSTSYYIGVGHTSQEGIWRPMAFNRSGLRVNIDQKINDRLKIATSNTLSRSNRTIGRAVGSGGTGALYQSSVDIPTTLPIYDEDGRPLRWSNFDNIAQLIENYDANTISNHYIGSLNGQYEISPKWVFTSSFSLDYNLYEEDEYWNTNIIRGTAANGEAISSLTQSDFFVNEQTLSYKNTINEKHNFNFIVGNHIQSSVVKNTYARGTNFPNNQFKLISAAANQTADESWSKNNLVSVFSRLNYGFDDKYLFEATFRADGSSKFANKNRWGYFPSVGAAWIISNEKFFSDASAVNHLKLRTSYGSAGNQNGISDFGARGLWTAGAGYPDGGTSELPGTIPLQLANPDLRWEKTTQLNVGFDALFLNGRLGFEINYYNKYTTDALLQIPVPGSTGFSAYLTNFGELSNKGFEFSVNTVNIDRSEFKWKSSFNVSQNVNKVEVLPEPILYERFSRIEQGVALYSYWLYNVLEVDPQTGDLVIEDVNGDGVITTDDRKIVGDAWPKFFGGLTNNLSYKSFDLNFLFTFSYGNRLWNHNRLLNEHGGTLGDTRALTVTQLDRWQKPGDITDVPRLALQNYNRQEISRFFEDASFLRLRNLTLGYTLPPIKNTQLRVYVTGTNLWLLTKYLGADPETRIERGENQNIQGYDFASPPTPRTIQFGVNLTL